MALRGSDPGNETRDRLIVDINPSLIRENELSPNPSFKLWDGRPASFDVVLIGAAEEKKKHDRLCHV